MEVLNVPSTQTSSNSNIAPPIKGNNIRQIKEHLQQTKSPHELLASLEQLTPGQMQEMVADANQFFRMTQTHLEFHLHEKLDRYYVKVIDAETKELIREIPPEKLLNMYAAMRDLMGLLVDKRV